MTVLHLLYVSQSLELQLDSVEEVRNCYSFTTYVLVLRTA